MENSRSGQIIDISQGARIEESNNSVEAVETYTKTKFVQRCTISAIPAKA
jgi:hypothetical protein